eukprot:m.105074 g.105074  ORF g.105074 m.105074 type:complete len:160 (-) comp15271_c0_seq2:214-693(-)
MLVIAMAARQGHNPYPLYCYSSLGQPLRNRLQSIAPHEYGSTVTQLELQAWLQATKPLRGWSPPLLHTVYRDDAAWQYLGPGLDTALAALEIEQRLEVKGKTSLQGVESYMTGECVLIEISIGSDLCAAQKDADNLFLCAATAQDAPTQRYTRAVSRAK